MDKKLFKKLNEIQKTLQEKENFLNELDNKIGDGDHGTNMVRGFNLAIKEIKKEQSVKDTFNKIGQVLLSKVGGASGPLYGLAFIKGSEVLKEDFGFNDLQNFVKKATEAIKKLGKAELKDKTMVDVWEPACSLLKEEKDVDKIKKQIEHFVFLTKDLLAKKGRASYLGKRSIGTIDPGSFSTKIILTKLLEATC